MNIKNALFETLRTIRDGGAKVNSKTQVDDDIDVLEDVELTEIDTLIKTIKDIAKDREGRYIDYETMMQDAIIGGAVELIADECVQVSDVTGLSYWIESEDNDFEAEANMWLKEVFDINSEAYNMGVNFVVYGDVFYRTFQNDENASKGFYTVGEYFENVNPRYVQELQYYGKVQGYNYIKPTDDSSDTLFGDDEFIHVYNKRNLEPEYLEVEFLNKDTLKTDIRTCTVVSGKSFLESSRQAFKILDLLDSMVLSSRISMSQVLRIFNMEVKNSDRKQTRKMVAEFKSSLQSQSLEKDKKLEVGKKVSSISNLVVPTRDGKGDIQVTTEGGDIDVKSLADLDYYTNKLMASLRVPKAFLGLDDTQALIGSNGSLTRQDVRYARMIKAIKALICEVVKQVLVFSWEKRGKKVPLFQVMTTSVSTVEDIEEQEAISVSVGTAQQLKDMLSEIDIVDQEKLLVYLVEHILRLPKSDKFLTQEYLDKIKKEAVEKAKQQEEVLKKSRFKKKIK